MAKQSAPFTSLPRNVAVERKNLRYARVVGLPPVVQPNMGDAFRVVGAAAAYVDAFNANKTTIPFFGALADAWSRHKPPWPPMPWSP